MPVHKKGKNGNKKHGRNKLSCERYRREGRRMKNKIRKWTKLIKRQPNNKQLFSRLRAVS